MKKVDEITEARIMKAVREGRIIDGREALEAALMVMTSKEVRLEKQADAITMVRSQLAAHRKQGDEQ